MIRTENLTKRYGRLVAADNLSFSVSPGEVLGFLGPNGAGKSTTMKMIVGFVTPTRGSIEVCGYDVESKPTQAKQQVGYLPEGAPSYSEMSPAQYLRFIADIRGLRGARRRDRIQEVIERLHLEPVLTQPVETLSKGFKRRLGLAQAILHDPPALILDEPTDGLDPNQKYEVRELISQMARHKIIIISTHILEEVDAVCNRAIIISHGRILADESPEELRARSRYHNAVTLRVAEARGAREAIAALPGVSRVETNGADNHLTAIPRDQQSIYPAVNALATDQGWNIREFRVESGRLDEVFRGITHGERV